jgi:hypothetical protein
MVEKASGALSACSSHVGYTRTGLTLHSTMGCAVHHHSSHLLLVPHGLSHLLLEAAV